MVRVGVLALLLVAATRALADSWSPYASRRVVSPSGKHYAVVYVPQRHGPSIPWLIRLRLYERREGVAALPSVVAGWDARYAKPHERRSVEADPGDRLIADATLRAKPYEMHVLDREPGVVFYESYGGIGRNTTLALFQADGTLKWKRSLKELFSEEKIRSFRRSVSSIWWAKSWWVDEDRARVLVLSQKGDLRAVALADGAVTHLDPQELARTLDTGTVAERAAVLDLAAELRFDGLTEHARKLAQDKTAPAALRLRAAVAVYRAKKEALLRPSFLYHAIMAKDVALRAYALEHAGEMCGPDAMPALREGITARMPRLRRAARTGFLDLGKQGILTLFDVMRTEDAESRADAAMVLGALGAAEVLKPLLHAARDEDALVANAGIQGALASSAPGLADGVLELLAGGLHVTPIAGYLEQYPDKRFTQPLLAALERSGAGSPERAAVAGALRACTRRDFGEDPAAWRRGLASASK